MDERIQYLEKKLKTFPRFPLSLVPTPCHRLNYLSESYGVEVFCKRDDMTGLGYGGNKSRKLEFLIGEAKEHRCDTLVTSGGLQSNFCRLSAAAGAAAGMSVHLVLGGGRPSRATGNILLDEMLGASISYVESPQWDEWERESESVAKALEAQGKKVFRMPIGGSVPVGVAGYVAVFLEILRDEERLGLTFDHILHASSSGGTQAGLVVGKDFTGWPGTVTGICVVTDRNGLENKVIELAMETASMLGGKVDRASVVVDGGFVGPGYAVRTEQAEKAIQVFARREGIFLDHVYTGKAAAGLLHYLETGAFKGKKVLFLHTGGHPELFA